MTGLREVVWASPCLIVGETYARLALGNESGAGMKEENFQVGKVNGDKDTIVP